MVRTVFGQEGTAKMKPANQDGFDYKRLVREGYDRCSEVYTNSRQSSDMPQLDSLIHRLPRGAAVLDIGCGGGVPVTSELAKTCRVTGVDISPVQVILAERNVPSGHFLCGDVMAMTFPEASFNAVVLFYAILHLPKEEHRELFARVHRWLKPNGLLLASLSFRNEDAYTQDNFFGVRMYWSNWGIDHYRQMLAEIGFALLEESRLEHGYKDGVKTEPEAHPLICTQKVS
jgi:SAM-dependent methyltransferase